MRKPNALELERWTPLVFAVITLLFANVTLSAQAAKLLKITGTYTNMYFNREGGDLLGQELKIVGTQKGYQDVLQFAEGEPSELIVVDIKLSAKKIEFAVPDSSPNACQFSGLIEGEVSEGSFDSKLAPPTEG